MSAILPDGFEQEIVLAVKQTWNKKVTEPMELTFGNNRHVSWLEPHCRLPGRHDEDREACARREVT
jgi:hypothetical protein